VPDYRGRGCQAALLRRRIDDAAAAGCELVASQLPFGSGAQRNVERAGLRVACTKAIWCDGTVRDKGSGRLDD
jgi:GNAT superfamily N-acetyltransferase